MNKIPEPILVTGAAGFVGSHLVERLMISGHRVRALVRYNSLGSTGWLPKSVDKEKIEIVRGDIRDYDSVRTAVSGCSTVFHLAALIGIPYSYESPLAYLKTNGEGTYNILEACRREGTENLLITSTSEVYGEARYFPIKEDHPIRAHSPYAASKIGADQLAISYHAAFGLPLKIIRPFNIFGPRQSVRAIIPTVITQLLGGDKIIQLGNVYPTRDWTYVQDVVTAFEKIAESPAFVGQVVHIGSGIEVSVSDIVEQVARLMGRKVEMAVDSTRVRPSISEVSRLLCDSTKLRNQTGWIPSYSLELGLKETINWIQTHLEMYSDRQYVI